VQAAEENPVGVEHVDQIGQAQPEPLDDDLGRDWGALHLRQDLRVGAGLAAAGYAAFALAEAIGRLSGTSLLEYLGRTRVLVIGGLTACAGMLVASLAPDVWLALAGFAATGLGLANLFPAAYRKRNL
jgi:MFS family permease